MRTSPVTGLLLASSLFFGPLVTAGCGGGDTSASSGGGGSGTTTTTDSGGGGAGGMTSTGGTGGSEFVMQPHPPFPTIQGMKSAVIAHPKLVTITFQGDTNESKVQAFDDLLVTSDWVTTVGADYGVGAGTHLAKVVLPFECPTPTTEPDILQLIDEQITAGAIPKPDDNTIYMIQLPSKVVFDDGQGYAMCTDYLGYHWQGDLPTNGTMTYAFIGECDIGFDEVTATLAHEYIETASDPGFSGGFFLAVPKTHAWISQQGMENADMCDSADYVQEGGFTFQRVWSNTAAAAAITSPCAPIDPNEVFYDVYADPQTPPKVAAGQSATFTLTGWSTAPMADWALDYDAQYFSEFEPKVEMSAKTINNGTTVTVTLTVPPGTPKGRQGTAMIYSGDGYGRFWPVTVFSN
ncbi:MAG: hypothetical protein U0441_17240 [Polyangiaceae bacterium]